MSPARSRLGTVFLILLVGAAVAADAQPQAKLPRIGLLGIATREGGQHNLEAFWRGMRERGWVEGQNILSEERWAEGRVERLASLASELVRLKVDVIFAGSNPAAQAA